MKTIVIAVLLSGAALAADSDGLAFGAGVMIQQGQRFCHELQQYGSRVNWLTLAWQRIQPRRGEWVWRQFDSWVDGYRACGQEVFVHILSNAAWAIEPPPPGPYRVGHPPSMPARNPQDYYDFVYAVAAHYKGRIAGYAIENEAHAAQNWGGTPDEYMQELETGYRAIHAADPGAIVTDAAMSHLGLAYLTANWLYQNGQAQRAIEFVNSYVAHFRRLPPHLTNAAQLARSLGSPGVQAVITWENKLFDHHAFYDHMQIHNGAPYYDFAVVLDYLHTNLKARGDDKPLDVWESWYSWMGAPGNGFDPDEQAAEIVRFIATAAAGGVNRYVYWLFNDWAIGEGHPGLVDNPGNPRPAAEAFKLVSEKLTGAPPPERLDVGGGAFAYKFTNGGREIYIVWSIGASSVRLPFSGSATVTDIAGHTHTLDSDVIPVTAAPVFVEPAG